MERNATLIKAGKCKDGAIGLRWGADAVYLAHLSEDGGREQALCAHLMGTAERAAEFAGVFGAQAVAYRCGLLHDIGKYSAAFQRRVRGSNERTDHTTAGALEARRLGDIPAAFCIAGHHGGLPDGGNKKADKPTDATFFGKMKRTPGVDLEDYSPYSGEITVPPATLPREYTADAGSLFFFTRMLYACLIDADRLDTEAAMDGPRDRLGQPLDALFSKLERHIAPWWDAKTDLNRRRCAILRAALDSGALARGLFSMTVPTGGGKTVSSMAFALKHALAHGMRRVIYVIPYTSIIEQTQAVFEAIFGADNVIAHFANVEFPDHEDGALNDRRRLAAENWDAPIVLTTAVQFFESLFSHKSSRCRKLHNIANSVLIFDEAQMLPPPYLEPCVWAISRLTAQYGCSAVLCTATQPALDGLFARHLPGFPIRELCPDVAGTYDFFRRVRYVTEGAISDEALTERLNTERQVLCVVSTKRQAQTVFARLNADGRFHLSTAMTPAHRRRVLGKIRKRLKDGEPCRVVSTSLIEAGVDVDFPTVWRALAGLDAMIHAGGRCNREGKRSPEESVVHLFEPESPPPSFIRQNVAAARETMRKFDDIASPDAIHAYFAFLNAVLRDPSEADKKQVLPEINAGGMPFASVSQRVRLIEDGGRTLYVLRGEDAAYIEALRAGQVSRGLLRRLGQHAVSVPPNYFARLVGIGAAEYISDDAGILLDTALYSEESGLALDIAEGVGLFS